MTKLPFPYIHQFRDRHGKLRRYVRLPGRKRVALTGEAGSREFKETYETIVHGKREEIGANRTIPGTISAGIVSYYNSAAFASLAPETQRVRRNILERFRAEHGDKRIAVLQRAHIDRMVAAKAATPAAARNFLNTVRALMQHTILQGWREDDPTHGVRRPKMATGGFRTWTEEDIATFEAAHPVGTRARLALGLLLHTAQRRSDVVRMGRQHVRDGVIEVRVQKTRTVLAIPLHPALQAILEATPSDHLTFLVTREGSPFTPPGFTNWFREMCKAAGLPRGLSPHGLRKAACRRLAEAGCSANVIAAVSGHVSLREIQRYTAAADQARMARTAIDTVAAMFPSTVKR
jgi:integrase